MRASMPRTILWMNSAASSLRMSQYTEWKYGFGLIFLSCRVSMKRPSRSICVPNSRIIFIDFVDW